MTYALKQSFSEFGRVIQEDTVTELVTEPRNQLPLRSPHVETAPPPCWVPDLSPKQTPRAAFDGCPWFGARTAPQVCVTSGFRALTRLREAKPRQS